MIKLAARVGIIGPILFGSVLFTLTLLKFDFLLSLGWDPIHAPTFDWPSGLALGAYGWIMTLTFIVSGLMMTIFASGLRLSLLRSRLNFFATETLLLAGIFLAGLAFTTDPTIRSTPATWHGMLHDLSFVLLGITFMSAMILLGSAFRYDDHWQGLSSYSWLTTFCVASAFGLKGAAFYIFLLLALIWCEVIAIRLNTIATQTSS